MYATVDIGTNSVLLLIAAWQHGKLVVHRDEAEITRLGAGLHQSHTFSEAAKKRTLAILEKYQTLCVQEKVKKVVVAGMSAFRRAQNGPEFLQEIATKFGWKPRLLSGEEEAKLAYRSVKQDFGEKYQHLYALDIGGGSTEIISPTEEVSFNLGSVILTETYLKHCPPRLAEFLALKSEVDIVTTGFHPPYVKGSLLVGLAGTVTTLSAINQGLKQWTPERIQGSILKMGEVDLWIQKFSELNFKQLRALPGMVRGREDTILAGTLILKRVMELLQVNLVMVSDRGVRYGLFYEAFQKND